jgi:hypothetical protein
VKPKNVDLTEVENGMVATRGWGEEGRKKMKKVMNS